MAAGHASRPWLMFVDADVIVHADAAGKKLRPGAARLAAADRIAAELRHAAILRHTEDESLESRSRLARVGLRPDGTERQTGQERAGTHAQHLRMKTAV